MAGVDKHTGKVIGREEHIKQGIETILTTPVGTRVMRLEFGNEALREDGRLREELTSEQVCELAKAALVRWEPRASFHAIVPVAAEGGLPDSLLISYLDKEDAARVEQQVKVRLFG